MQVKAEFSKKTVMVSVDGNESDRTPTKGHTLDVEGKLYLGGLPATYTAKRIGNVIDLHETKTKMSRWAVSNVWCCSGDAQSGGVSAGRDV